MRLVRTFFFVQVRSLAADPVKALASLAVEPMEVLLGGGEDNYDADIYIL